ncbi:MAG TPA: aldose 1-epimerase family protein [Sphingobacteriaceae bacterium]
MVILENEVLRVVINPKGAELASVYNKRTQIEHIWQADPAIWPWHAPNLFPVVGECLENKITIKGIPYKMGRHGFARHSKFIVMEATNSHAEFSLGFCESTLEVYPYEFQFQVFYDLLDNGVKITYKVINEDEKSIYFSVGGHPAFNVPFHAAESFEEYYIQFEYPEELKTHLLTADGFFSGETEKLPLQDGKLMLTRQLLAKGALVFKDLMSKKVMLRSINRSLYLEVSFPRFPYIALWAKEDAPFICIEPWFGCADTAGDPKDISEKEGMRELRKGHVFESDYTISIIN